MSIEHRVKQVIIRTLDLEIDAEDTLSGDDLRFNSMAAVALIVALEEEFEFEVPDEDLSIELLDSMQTISDYIRSALKGDLAKT